MRYLVLTAIVLVIGCSPSAPSKLAESQSETRYPIPTYPVGERDYALGDGWSLRLPGEFRHRVEDGNLILWRRGLTIYAVVWNNAKKESETARLSWIKQNVSPESFEVQELQDTKVLRFSYRLSENRKEGLVHALYGYAIGQSGHVQMAVYFDRDTSIDLARKIWLSVTEHLDTQTH
jgi:hypothetical protein